MPAQSSNPPKPKISPEFARRLARLAPDAMARAVVLLDTGPAPAAASGRSSTASAEDDRRGDPDGRRAGPGGGRSPARTLRRPPPGAGPRPDRVHPRRGTRVCLAGSGSAGACPRRSWKINPSTYCMIRPNDRSAGPWAANARSVVSFEMLFGRAGGPGRCAAHFVGLTCSPTARQRRRSPTRSPPGCAFLAEAPGALAAGGRSPGKASARMVKSSKSTSTEWSDTPVSAASRTSVRSSGPSSTVRSTRKG